MQIKFRNSISFAFLIISLWVTIPIKSLHDCNNLNHTHPELCFENEHEECNICDLSIQSYEPFNNELAYFYPSYSLKLHSAYLFSFSPFSYTCLDNRGPPYHSNI